MALRIRDWQKHFEHGDHRKVARMTWVKLPNKHDGAGYRTVIRAGEIHYACWVLLVQVASKCTPRGWLVDDQGRALSAETLEIKTDMPAKRYEAALPVLLETGWLETIPEQDLTKTFGSFREPSGTFGESAARGQDRTGQDMTGQNTVCSEPPQAATAEPSSPVFLTFPVVGKGARTWELREAKLAEYAASFPALDVRTEMRKAAQWCVDNPGKRKTAKGMPAFCTRWLSRAVDNPCARQDAAFGHVRRQGHVSTDAGYDAMFGTGGEA